MKKTLYRTLAVILLAAIIAVIGMSLNKDESTMQSNRSMLVDTTQQLIIYDITDFPLDLACGQMPDTANENVVFCAAAAFTGKCLDYFDHTNILGQHISNGVLYEGYTEDKDGIPFAERYALFVWQGIDSLGRMLPKGFHSIPNNLLLEKTTLKKGMAFTQHRVIKDGEVFSPCIQPLERSEHFRSICHKGDRYMVIANKDEMPYSEYLDLLLAYGVENALYMDMGSGWNHSFYRDADNQLHIIHPKTHSYPTNWLVVYKH